MTEAEFLDLYSLTRKKITPAKFYETLNPIVKRIRTDWFQAGYDRGTKQLDDYLDAEHARLTAENERLSKGGFFSW